jgi:hypothetical protein
LTITCRGTEFEVHKVVLFTHVYAIADKYDVPHLCTLAKLRLQKTFNVQTSLSGHADFIGTVRAVDEYTPHRLGLEGRARTLDGHVTGHEKQHCGPLAR